MERNCNVFINYYKSIKCSVAYLNHELVTNKNYNKRPGTDGWGGVSFINISASRGGGAYLRGA